MSHDLEPQNKEIGWLHLTSWMHLIEQCGSYFTCISRGARWYMVFDERMTTHYHDVNDDGAREKVTDKEYPAIFCNCGFEVTEEEAKVMACIARNYAAIQRTLDEPTEEIPFDEPEYKRPFPQYIRRDWVEQFEKFAKWAEQSQGFKVY